MLKYELPPEQNAPTRGGPLVESGTTVPFPLRNKGPPKDVGVTAPCTNPAASAVVANEFRRAPLGANLVSGDVALLSKDRLLPPHPAAPHVKHASTKFSLVGCLAACGLGLVVLLCHRRLRRIREERAAAMVHALGRGGSTRRRLHVPQIASGVQGRRRGRVAARKRRKQQQRASIILHALGRGGLVRIRVRRSRAAAATAMTAIASCDAARHCANPPEADKHNAEPVSLEKVRSRQGRGGSLRPGRFAHLACI